MKKLRIVIADDGREVRDYVRGALMGLGHEVVGVGRDGHEAVDLCAEHKPDLAVLDLSMGEKSGHISAQEILKEKNAEKVLLMTSMAQLKDQIENEYGLNFIAKPIHRLQLGKKIDSLFEE